MLPYKGGGGESGYITTVHSGTGGAYKTTDVGQNGAPYQPYGNSYGGYEEQNDGMKGGNWKPGDWYLSKPFFLPHINCLVAFT